MIRALTRFSVRLVERYLPDPYIFVILLTLLAGVAAVGVEGKGPMEIVRLWGDACCRSPCRWCWCWSPASCWP